MVFRSFKNHANIVKSKEATKQNDLFAYNDFSHIVCFVRIQIDEINPFG